MVTILGISAYYHDSAACIIQDGKIVAAAQEERFTRIKHDKSYPVNAIKYCLEEAGNPKIDKTVFYENPELKFDRVYKNLQSYPQNLKKFNSAINSQKQKIKDTKNFEYVKHHESHAASAFYPSPYKKAAIVTIDGVGEWDTTTISLGTNNKIIPICSLKYPDSLGMLYSAFTYFCGFKVNNGEYKLMGLAPYGEPKYYDLIKDNLIDIKKDGSFALNLEYFSYFSDSNIINNKFESLFNVKRRQPESEITKVYVDIAASIQKITEEIVLNICDYAQKVTGQTNICLAGGVALNCVANGKLLHSKLFKNIWIQPAAGDAGGALGAALLAYYKMGFKRQVDKDDSMQTAYLGPNYDNYIPKFLKENNIKFEKLDLSKVASYLGNEKVVGWYQGRMEFGPRALGHRSILGDARSKKMQSIMNLKIKFRESFRPFAPIVLEEDVNEYFNLNVKSPYMLIVSNVKKRLIKKYKKLTNFNVIDQVNQCRSSLPAITHVDQSARIQTVSKKNDKLYLFLKEFKKRTGSSVLINTSFNVRGEPIVCTPQDAYKCFMSSGMDYLVLGDYVIKK